MKARRQASNHFNGQFALPIENTRHHAFIADLRKIGTCQLVLQHQRLDQVHFAHLQLGAQATIGTEGITKSFGWDAKEGQASVQHDIQELYCA